MFLTAKSGDLTWSYFGMNSLAAIGDNGSPVQIRRLVEGLVG